MRVSIPQLNICLYAIKNNPNRHSSFILFLSKLNNQNFELN